MATTPFASRGTGDLIIRDGDAVSGNSATGGAGGNLTLEGGDATASTNTDGGDVVLQPGLEDGTGTIGEILLTNRAGTEDDAIVAFQSVSGANAHTIRLRTGTVAPNADSVPATAGGDIYVQSDGTLWVSTAAGTGNWSDVSGGGGGASLATTLGIGNLTGGNNISVSTGDSIVGVAELTLSSVTTMDLDATTALSINSSGGVINIGDDAVAQNINIGTGAAARVVSVGNSTGASGILLTSGSGDITLTPNAGNIVLDYATWPSGDGTNGQVITTDGAGGLTWSTGSASRIAQNGVITEGLQFFIDFNNQSSWTPNQTTTWVDVIEGTSGTASNTTIVNGHLNFNSTTSVVNFGALTSGTEDLWDSGGTAMGWIRAESDGESSLARLYDTNQGTEGTIVYVDGESGGFMRLNIWVRFSSGWGQWEATNLDIPINE